MAGRKQRRGGGGGGPLFCVSPPTVERNSISQEDDVRGVNTAAGDRGWKVDAARGRRVSGNVLASYNLL